MSRGVWARLCLLLAAAQPSKPQPPERTTFPCGGVFTGESGYFGSEGFPGVYPPNSRCSWKITVPEGKVVVLNFREFDLESDELCRYDSVDVYSGHSYDQRVAHLCGRFQPGSLVSVSNKMMVHMVSDANTAGNGFLATFSAAERNRSAGDLYCGGRLEKPSGSFKTPNWPEQDYPAGVTCMWYLIAPKGQVIELKFEKFDVERDKYCRYDFVDVFNSGEVNTKRVGRYCGDSPPAPIVSEKNELLIQFVSDLSLTADGFIAHYKFRPKKLPTTTAAAVTTPAPVTTGLKPKHPVCQRKCKWTGTLESNYCSSNFVLAGTVISLAPRGRTLHATISIINIYKEGSLAVQQAGKNMSAKVIVDCKQCPLLRRGQSYIIMGHVGEDGRGKVMPNSLVTMFKPENQKLLNVIRNKQC